MVFIEFDVYTDRNLGGAQSLQALETIAVNYKQAINVKKNRKRTLYR